MTNKVGWLITAYDQVREVKFTIETLRRRWKQTATAPITIVISGDDKRELRANDPYTRVVHLDDIVGNKHRTHIPLSVIKQIRHGMLELADLERVCGPIETILHMHGDILLLNESGFWDTWEKWKKSGKPLAVDNVGQQGPYLDVDCDGELFDIRFFGCEIMPQLFAVNHQFCKNTGYMYEMSVEGRIERVATEWSLVGNLHRKVMGKVEAADTFPFDVRTLEASPYQAVFNAYAHVVKWNRGQWDLHQHWGGFTHFGNSIHYTKEYRERCNEAVLRAYNIDLAGW